LQEIIKAETDKTYLKSLEYVVIKAQIASECCFAQGLENGIAEYNSCATLLGILIRDFTFPDWGW